MLSTEYEGKLDNLDKKLDQVGRIMDTLAAPRHTPEGTESPTHDIPTHRTSTPRSIDLSSANNLAVREKHNSDSQTISGRRAIRSERSDERVVEGLSSLSANSTFAIDLMHRVAGADRERGYDFETRELLDRLQQIINAVKSNRMARPQSFPTGPPSKALTDQDNCNMPPIQAAVAVIQKAKEQDNSPFSFIGPWLHPLGLSDLCLKVYFSEEYTDAEYIIINIVLYCLFDDDELRPTNQRLADDPYDRHKLLCQANLEIALARVPLVFSTNYDMVLALTLGTIYAVDISKPALAWVYVTAAQQSSYLLGFHTRSEGADGSGAPNKMGLLFWAIYFLEKTLCLRLGRCSTILDIEITVPLPGGSPTSNDPSMGYYHELVRLASLAGRTYERLYSAHALAQPNEERQQRVVELSRELQDISTKLRNAITPIFPSSCDEAFIDYICHSDEMLCFSMQTLILRAAPTQLNSATTFTDDCISAARAALASHAACVPALSACRTPRLASHLHWTVLFSPFIPFIALFCHVIETGDVEDLGRMHTFVCSLESACEHSSAIAKHHALFQVFHNVAARYTELKSTSTPTQPEQAEHRVEMGTYLSELGFQPQMIPASRDGIEGAAGGSAAETPYVPMILARDGLVGNEEAEQAEQLANWLTVSQQMMGLLDNNELPF